jgi:hypothetical protein
LINAIKQVFYKQTWKISTINAINYTPNGGLPMKTSYPLLSVVMLLILTLQPANANPIQSVSPNDQKITDLSNRLNSFETNWNRFQIGGDLTLKSSTHYQQTQAKLEQLHFDQQLDLYFNTSIDRYLGTSVKLTHYGGWGQYSNYPMSSPLQLDEAYLHWNQPTLTGNLGRFHFSLSQLGLISDFTTIPIEGATFQKAFGNFQAIVLYSRVYTTLGATTGAVDSAEDYWAARLGWSNRNQVFGINLAPNGIMEETSFSIDWSLDWACQKLAVEAAWRSFDSNDPLLHVTRTPGILISYSKVSGNNDYLQIKVGYFAKSFEPQYSSLAHISGNNREWFVPNSQGIELFGKKQLKPGWNWENRILLFQPLVEYGSPSLNYRFTSTVIRDLSPVNHLMLGIDLKEDYAGVDSTQIVVSWNLRF